MKMRFNLALASIIISTLAILPACKKNPKTIIINNPVSSTAPFENLEVHGNVKVILTPDTINKADSAISGNVVYNYKGQTLSLSGAGVVQLSIHKLNLLSTYGASTIVTTDTLELDTLVLSTRGASAISLQLDIKKLLHIASSGGSDNYTLIGKCPKFTANVSGSSYFHNYDFITQDAAIDMNGSGKFEVFCSNSLTVNLKGSATVYYKGNPPTVNQSVKGAAQLIKQ
jgi:hypothetical protein